MPDRPPRRGELWAADLNPRRRTEPGKVRPVLVIQSDLLNETRKAILNVARIGKFSSARTIEEYARDIWGIRATC